MLRGRRSRTISERPTPSPTPKNPLTPLFPLDTSHSPVTPLFPLDTQNGGVPPPSNMTNRSILEFSPARLPHLSTAIFHRRFLFRQPLPLCALRVLGGESSFFFGLSSPSRRIAAKNAINTDIPLWLSISIINNVGAPTYCSRNRNKNNRQFLDPGKVFPSHYRLLAGECELPSSPKSFVFSRYRYYILNYMNNNNVGAPTYCKWFATGASAL